MINHLMMFAAGFGKRMNDLTTDKPKPLIEINGKPLLHYALEFAIQYNRFKLIVINTHYLAAKIEESVDEFKRKNSARNLPEIIIILEEPKILETGGAVKNAYKYFTDQEAIFTLNTDAFLLSKEDPFSIMNEKWDPEIMDFLLLLSEQKDVIGQPANDFGLIEGRLISRKDEKYTGKYYTYTGLQILKPKLVYYHNEDIFPIGKLVFQHRSCGILNNGLFYHANNKEHISKIESCLFRA